MSVAGRRRPAAWPLWALAVAALGACAQAGDGSRSMPDQRVGGGSHAGVSTPGAAPEAATAVTADPQVAGMAAGAASAAAPSVDALERAWAEVTRLAAATGCSSDAQCHSLGVGSKACGGPASYLAWSSERGDGGKLAAALQRHAALAGATNQRAGRMSTCALVPDPGAVCKTSGAGRRCELQDR